ncbi:MAG: hypothetical protein QGI60_05915 [archaeon]|jgi:hypothetical protein|nr:hypothetical protein [archaeon]
MENLAKKSIESTIDTFLLRTLFVLMVVSEYLPMQARACENKLVYYGVIGVAFLVTAALYPVGLAIDTLQKAVEFLKWAKQAEYKAEFYFRTHHIFLILAFLIYAVSILRVLL